MKIHGLGKDASGGYINGHLQRLETLLTYYQQLGYDVVELSVTGLNVIINGQLFPRQVQAVKDMLSRYPFRYTVHAPNRTNLAYGAHHALEKEVLRACIQFCAAIDARRLVYHSGLQALDAARTGLVALPDDETLKRGAEQEVTALRELAVIAEDADVIIGMENGDTHLWEYAVLHSNQKSPDELARYHARLRIQPMIDQLTAIGHPNIGMTLDLAHLHIAAHAVGDNYLDAVTLAAPYVRHLHMNDNFGKLDVGFDSETDRLPYGEADLHLPPGWGSIPYEDVFRCLRAYEGDLILEIKEQYWDYFGEALENTKQLLASIGDNT